MKRSSLTLCAFLPALLAGCASSHEPPKPTRLCPQVAILRELELFREYDAQKPDSDPVVVASMNRVEGGCEYNEKGADVRFSVILSAKRKAGFKSDKVAVPYFISLISPDGSIVKKDLMTAGFSFGSGDKLAGKKEDLHVFVPVPEDISAEGYRVLLGFQLTEDQLKQVRAEEAAKRQR